MKLLAQYVAEHTVSDRDMDHAYGTVPFEVPVLGAVLSPDEFLEVSTALSEARCHVVSAALTSHAAVSGLHWELAARLGLAKVVMAAAQDRTGWRRDD